MATLALLLAVLLTPAVSAFVLRGVRPDADRAAQDAALRSRWRPKLLDGRPVGVVLTVTFQFPPHVWSRPRVTPRSRLPLERGPVVFVDPTRTCPKGKGGPIRVGSSLGDPPLLDYVEPAAPLRDESGVVVIEALIGGDGKVTRMKPLREAPGLTEPAMDAIGKWRYARACLGGQPVPLIITIALRSGASDRQ